MPGSITVAQRPETTVGECSMTSCVWSPFRIGSHTICTDSGRVSPLRLRWVSDVCGFRCNLPPALLAEWPGCFTCHCGNTGVEQTPTKSQHTKLTLEKKILQPLLPGFELATFPSRVRRSNQQAIPATGHYCQLVGALSPVNHKWLNQGWGRLS